MRSNRCSCCSP